jgi:hypothetical protein
MVNGFRITEILSNVILLVMADLNKSSYQESIFKIISAPGNQLRGLYIKKASTLICDNQFHLNYDCESENQ